MFIPGRGPYYQRWQKGRDDLGQWTHSSYGYSDRSCNGPEYHSRLSTPLFSAVQPYRDRLEDHQNQDIRYVPSVSRPSGRGCQRCAHGRNDQVRLYRGMEEKIFQWTIIINSWVRDYNCFYLTFDNTVLNVHFSL